MKHIGLWACCASILLTGNLQAALSLLAGPPIATPAGNLVTNGSFEAGAPAPGAANLVYWATGTTNLPFSSPPGWVSQGAPDNYALWVLQVERQVGEWTLVAGYAGEITTAHRGTLVASGADFVPVSSRQPAG